MINTSHLTEKQKEVLEIVSSYTKSNGYPPTLREILERSTLKSVRGVVLQLQALEKLGILDRNSNARAISLNQNYSPKKTIKVPLMSSTISAGLMKWVDSNEDNYFEKYIEINFLACKGYKTLYAVKVQGDSMIDANIFENDYLLFVNQSRANDGDIVLAIHDEEMTVKKFRIVEGRPILFPANKKYQPILSEFSIQGKVINIVKDRDANITSANSNSENI